MATILTFPVIKDEYFTTKQYKFYEEIQYIPWDDIKRDIISLNQALRDQIGANYLNFIRLYNQCEKKEDHNITTIIQGADNSPDGQNIIKNYPINQEMIKNICQKFHRYSDDTIDVMRRDVLAINQRDFNVEIYAVVLINNNQYYGHIYTWMSPTNNNVSIAMGIRGRVDNLFLREIGEALPNVSSYLLEGVRRFALINGATKIIIPYPLDVMGRILPTFGFRLALPPPPDSIIGNSLAPHHGSCRRCSILDNLQSSLIDKEIHYELIS